MQSFSQRYTPSYPVHALYYKRQSQPLYLKSFRRMDQQQILQTLPFLISAAPKFQQTFFDKSIAVTVPAGKVICLERKACPHLPIVLHGMARVYKANEEGKELTLYRIEAGESCILTTSCILNDIVFPANAVAVSDVDALVVPASEVVAWMDTYPDWRRYIFGLISERLSAVIELVEEVAFQRMDTRLSSYIREATKESPVLNKTHEMIATDLGTSREVISRLLKDLENKGIVELSRGHLKVMNAEKLV